jgi:hypothetical protein
VLEFVRAAVHQVRSVRTAVRTVQTILPWLGHTLPQDAGPVLLPEMIDFTGFRVHTAEPTERYQDSAGRLPYSMLGSQ